MRRSWTAASLAASCLVAFTLACTSSAPEKTAAARADQQRSLGPRSLGPKIADSAPHAPSATELAPAPFAPRLALRAFAVATRGDEPAARVLLARELRGRLERAQWDDADARADSELAALYWDQLASGRERWYETAAILAPWFPLPDATPPELASALEFLRAKCSRNLGRVDEARAITRSLGLITDWRIVGPFDNERGKGFTTKHPPEDGIDFGATYPGKLRDITWRANPAPHHPYGALVLSGMLRPDTQALAYLATSVRSDAARECVLRTASTGPLAVFVNGREVSKRKVERPIRPDQDDTVFALAPGWNRIVLESAVEEQSDWVLSARLVDLEGRPLLLETSSEHAVDAPPAFVKAKTKPAPRARVYFESRAAQDADAARSLALYHLVVHPDDTSAHSAIKAIEKVTATHARDADTLYLSALAHAPEPGTSREEMQVNTWIGPLKAVLALEPAHVGALCDLAEFSLDVNPLPERADELSARAHATAPRDPHVCRVRLSAVGALGLDAEVETLARSIIALDEHAWTDGGLARRARLELEHGDPDEALAVLERALTFVAYPGEALAEYIDRCADLGRADAIAAATERAVELTPFDVAARLRAAWRLEQLGAEPLARAQLEHARAIAPEDTGVLLALARLEQAAGRDAASDALLAEVLRIDPGQDRVRRQRELLAAHGEERFEAPYSWDASTVLAAAPASRGGNEPLTVVDRTLVCNVNAGGTSSTYEHIVWRIENEGGARALDVYPLFYPYGATLTVRGLRVLRKNGAVEPVPAPRRGDRGAEGGGVRVYDLPPLAPGDAVDVEYRVDETRPSVFGNYFGMRHEFYPDRPDPLAPTLRSELVLLAPRALELHVALRESERIEVSETRDAAGRSVRRYVARDLPRPPSETAMPRRSELAPRVDVSTYADWQAFATWWWSFIEKEFQSSPALSAKVVELTQGLATEREKIQALVRFCGQEIRYNSWPFGTHGYEPFSAPVIFERRFGDCKDKSILLCQMLSEIGVRAHPVLIKADSFRPEETLDAAMVEHFNHCIAYAPATAERAGLYLDCTADKNPIDSLRYDDQGARVLHVDGGVASLHDIPYAPPAENQLMRRYDVTLDAQGDGEVKVVDESNGAYGVALRSVYGGEQGDIKKRLARDLRGVFAQVEIADTSSSDLEDIGVPVRFEARFTAKKLATPESGGSALRLVFDELGIERVATEPPEARLFELVLDRPYAHDVTIRYRLPAGTRVASVPPRVDVRAAGLLSYVQEVRETDDGAEVHRRFELERRRIPLADYAAFRDALRQIEIAEQRTLRVTTGARGEGR